MRDLPIWKSVVYTQENSWEGISEERKAACMRHYPTGVEGRLLPEEHPLHGEYGLFATQRFSRFDVVGEYVGQVVSDEVTGHYVAALEDSSHDTSLGLNAEFTGNEMRFINSYLGVAEKANVIMKTAYISKIPHIMVICTEDIEPGQEILFDYGEAYNNAYLLKNAESRAHTQITQEDIHFALPFCDSDDEDEPRAEVTSIRLLDAAKLVNIIDLIPETTVITLESGTTEENVENSERPELGSMVLDVAF